MIIAWSNWIKFKYPAFKYYEFKYTLITEGNYGLGKLHFYFIIQNTKRHT